MRSFPILLSLVSLIAATPLAYEGQTPFNAQTPTYPGFDLDLNARRLVQLEGQEPVWMTELEKVIVLFHLQDNLLMCGLDSNQIQGGQVL